jgi:hypothetical protein
VGLGNRAVRKVFINGEIQNIGYLGMLRVHPSYRGKYVVKKGFELTSELHKDNRTKFYLVSIIEESIRARKLLTAGIKGFPIHKEYTRFYTFSIIPRRQKQPLKPPVDFKIIRGSPEKTIDIINVLQKCGKELQFYPYWDSSNLFDPIQTPDLRPENFLLAVRNDEVIGCLAIWDQRSFKQIVVREYSTFYKRARLLINAFAFLTGRASLPPINTSIPYCYISHVAIYNNDPTIFSHLLRAAYEISRQRQIALMMVGLPEHHPFISIIRNSYKFFQINSTIYLAYWEHDRIDPFNLIDDRTPGMEVAIL